MARVKAADGGIRALALDPLRNFKHETVAVAEWGGALVTVRALSAGDWVEYRRRAAELVSAARVEAVSLEQYLSTRDESLLPPGFVPCDPIKVQAPQPKLEVPAYLRA